MIKELEVKREKERDTLAKLKSQLAPAKPVSWIIMNSLYNFKIFYL